MEENIRQYYYAPTDLASPLYITWAGHRVCGPTHEIGPRILENYKMAFVVKGKGYLEQGNGPCQKIATNAMFILLPHERHHYYAHREDPWELMWVCFNGSFCDSLLDSIEIRRDNLVMNNVFNISIGKTITNILQSMADSKDPDNLRATGYMYILFAQVRDALWGNTPHVRDARKEDVVEKAMAFINQNYYLHINVEILCEHIYYSRSFLSRVFKNETGMSIPDYLAKVRIEHAKRLLAEVDIPVSEVSSSVGITDQFYFSKLFKKMTSLSPSEFRRQDLGESPEGEAPRL